MLNGFLADVALMAGMGALFDNIFISSDERAKISAYLKNRPADLTSSQRFSIFLQRAHAIIFGRFFQSEPLSLRFFISAATVSLLSFCVVFSAQMYLFPEALQLKFSLVQVALFVSFVSFNVFFDYFTIVQTKIFIEASLSAKTIFRAVLFIVSDLVVTMNLFILAYAFFVVFVIQWFVWTPEQATIIVQEQPPSEEGSFADELKVLGDFDDQPFVQRVRYRDYIGAALFAGRDMSSGEPIFVTTYSSFDPSGAETRALLLANISSLNVRILDLSAPIDEGEKEVMQAAMESVMSPLDLLVNEGNTGGYAALDFAVDGSVLRDGSFDLAYTASFFLTDQLEDAFPVSLTGSIELFSLSELIQSAMIAPLDGELSAICFAEGRPVMRLFLTKENYGLLDKCQEFVLATPLQAHSLDRSFSVVGRDVDDYRVPFNTLMITSILPTAFFYSAVILLAVSALLFSVLVQSASRVERFLLRAPLTVSGLLLGALMSLVGLI